MPAEVDKNPFELKKKIKLEDTLSTMRIGSYEHITTLLELGGACQTLKMHRKQIGYQEEALRWIHKGYFKSIKVESTLISLADAYGRLGDFDHKISILQNALHRLHSASPQEISIAYIQIYLGDTYAQKKEYTEAIRFYENAKIFINSFHAQQRILLANTFKALGLCYKALGDFSQQIQNEKIALESYGSNELFTIERLNLLNNLGGAHLILGDFETAISYYQTALKIISSNIGAFFIEYKPHILNNMGNVYGAMGNYAGQLEYQSEALKIATEYSPRDYAVIAMICANLANANKHLGNIELQGHYQRMSAQANAGKHTLYLDTDVTIIKLLKSVLLDIVPTALFSQLEENISSLIHTILSIVPNQQTQQSISILEFLLGYQESMQHHGVALPLPSSISPDYDPDDGASGVPSVKPAGKFAGHDVILVGQNSTSYGTSHE